MGDGTSTQNEIVDDRENALDVNISSGITNLQNKIGQHGRCPQGNLDNDNNSHVSRIGFLANRDRQGQSMDKNFKLDGGTRSSTSTSEMTEVFRQLAAVLKLGCPD